MGLLKTRWEADYAGHAIAVTRNELTRGFSIWWDGEEVAKRSWSWIGLGELEASVEATEAGYRDGKRTVAVKVRITIPENQKELDGHIELTVDEKPVPIRHVQ